MKRRRYTVAYACTAATPAATASMSLGGEFHTIQWKRASFLIGELARWGYAVTVTAEEIA